MGTPGRPHRPAVIASTNTLRMAPRDLEAIHAQVESGEHAAAAKREHARRAFRHDSLMVEMHQPGGDSTLRYACRDLSAGGVSLLHSSYVHVGAPCVVHIPRADGGTVPVTGRVVRCQFVKGKVHEFGVKFDVPINLCEFIRIDRILGEFAVERVDPAAVKASILHAASDEKDRKMIRHFVAETPAGVVSAATGAEALSRAKERFDLIVSSLDLGDMKADGLLDALAQAGVETPVLLIADEATTGVIEMARRGCASGMLSKPLDRDRFFRAVADITRTRSPDARRRDAACELPPGDPRQRLMNEAVGLLHRLGEELRGCVEQTHAARAATLCAEIRSTARSMGFAFIAATADDALAVLPTGPERPWPARLVGMLAELSVRAHAGTPRSAAA